jgi:hypothetical protein
MSDSLTVVKETPKAILKVQAATDAKSVCQLNQFGTPKLGLRKL